MSVYIPPARLPDGAVIGICAPSGAVNEDRLQKGVDALKRAGYRVKVVGCTGQDWRYFSATDEMRLTAFHSLLRDPEVSMIMAARGGYGISRLLDCIDYDLLAASQQILIGFSDFTALHLAALAVAKKVTFAGPMAAADFLGVQPEDQAWMEQYLWRTLRGETVSVALDPLADGGQAMIEGPIWGGNLTVLASLVGTRFFPDVSGGLLFLEDVDEQPYAVERTLLQLEHAGVFAQQKALILGGFTNCAPTNASRYPYSMAHVIETLRERLTIPVITGLPFGHIQRKITIPVGMNAQISINRGNPALSFSGAR
jgi:muramoyltetrapeptide carboxypeptidase